MEWEKKMNSDLGQGPGEPDFVRDCEAGEVTSTALESSRQVETKFLEEREGFQKRGIGSIGKGGFAGSRVVGRIKNLAAFSLAETLVATIILLLAAMIMTTGIPVAKNAYEKVVLAANAEVLLSTTVSTLKNELAMSRNINIGTETFKKASSDTTDTTLKTLVYYSGTARSFSRIYVDDTASEGIMFQRYAKVGDVGVNVDATSLIPASVATGNMYVTYSDVSYGSGLIQFQGLSVKLGEEDLVEPRTLSIRVIGG